MHLVEVAFKGNRKEFYLWEGEEPPPIQASVVVEADRGEDLGTVHATGEQAQTRCRGCSHGLGSAEPTRKALRVASSRDVRQAREVRTQDEVARQRAAERVKAHGLVMKVSDAEWQWDRKKLTFYFTADRRVDFRDLVRDLAGLFRARIELKQIGVRDEAKRLDGVGRCGRQFCSASWLPELRPVNLGVAKDQRLSLNPSQISGACGRLMCCLRYEHEFYVQSRKRFPKEGKTFVTARGEEKVVANEIFNERVTLRSTEGEIRVITLAQLRRELAATDHPLAAGEAAGGDMNGHAGPSLETGDLDATVDAEESIALDSAVVFDPELDGIGEPPRAAREAHRPVRGSTRAGAPPRSSDRPEGPPRPRTRANRPAAQARPDRAAAESAPAAESARVEEPGTEPVPSPLGSAEGAPGDAQDGRDSSPDGGAVPRRRRGRRGGRRGRSKGNGTPRPNGADDSGPAGPPSSGAPPSSGPPAGPPDT